MDPLREIPIREMINAPLMDGLPLPAGVYRIEANHGFVQSIAPLPDVWRYIGIAH